MNLASNTDPAARIVCRDSVKRPKELLVSRQALDNTSQMDGLSVPKLVATKLVFFNEVLIKFSVLCGREARVNFSLTYTKRLVLGE